MTALAPRPIRTRPYPARPVSKGNIIATLVHTTDHKTIGLMYIVTSFVFFGVGGLMALLMRTELARPGLQFLSNEQYNQLFTMHGTIMLLLYATPIVFGFANYILPLQIGSPDVAFPRLNAFSYWLYLFGGIITPASSPRGVRRTSGGPPTPRYRAPSAHPVPVRTCGSWGWRSPGWAASWVRSTWLPPWSACGHRG